MDDTLLYQKPVTLLWIPAVVAPAILMTVIKPSCSMMTGFFISNILGEQELSCRFLTAG